MARVSGLDASESFSMKNRSSALGLLTVAIIAISFAAIFFRKAAPTHPLVSSGLRLVFAAIIMLPFSLRHFKGLPPRFYGWAAAAGLCYAVHFGAWVWSLYLTSVAASTTLVTATPLVLALIGWLTGRDRPSRRLWSAIGLSVAGVVLIGANDLAGGSGQLIGDLLAFVGAIGMVGYLLIARRLRNFSPWVLLNISAAIGGLVLLSAAVSIGVPIDPANTDALFWIAMATLIPQMIGHTALTFSLRRAAPTAVAMATVAEPAGAAFLAWVILGDTVPPMVMFGCSLTLVAISVVARDLAASYEPNSTQVDADDRVSTHEA